MSGDGIPIKPSEEEMLITALIFKVGLDLADKARDEFIEVTNDAEEIQERTLAMVRTMQDHVLGVTHPFLNYAMEEAFNYPVETPDYGGICSRMGHSMDASIQSAYEASNHYHKLFCMENDCNGQLGYYGGIASVDATMARARSQERRQDRQEQARVRAIQQAHAGTMRNPGALFGLLDNAAAIYGTLQQNAFGNLSGTLSAFGYGIGGLASYFGGGGTD